MTTSIMAFRPGVSEKLGSYVYRLIDPRNGDTFYIGKGQGNRVFNHANAETKALDDLPEKAAFDDEDAPDDDLKIGTIRAIKNAGLNVIHIIHRHEMTDAVASEVEAALIDAFPGLSNKQRGHGSGAKGPMSVQQINDKFALPELESDPPEKLVLININRLKVRSSPHEILKQTRLAWRISKARAQQADYVLAAVRGVVVGAFVVHEWVEATHENFPDVYGEGQREEGRLGFKGEVAPPEIWERFVGERGKRVTQEAMKHVQNPIRYWGIR